MTETASEVVDKMMVSKIVVNGRHRKNLGDLEPLIESIKRAGLFSPILIDDDGELLAGQRRLVAVQRLGWESVPVIRVAGAVDAAAKLRVERDENTCRLDMTRSEQVSLGKALEELERPKAEARKAASQPRPGKRVGEETVSSPAENGKVSDIVGHAVGMSGPTYSRAKFVVETAEDDTLPPEIQEKARETRDKMDSTGNVKPAFDRAKHLRDQANESNGRGVEHFSVRHQQHLQAAARRVGKGIASLDGIRLGLESSDLAKATHGATEEQLGEWDLVASQTIKTLRTFRKRIAEEKT